MGCWALVEVCAPLRAIAVVIMVSVGFSSSFLLNLVSTVYCSLLHIFEVGWRCELFELGPSFYIFPFFFENTFLTDDIQHPFTLQHLT